MSLLDPGKYVSAQARQHNHIQGLGMNSNFASMFSPSSDLDLYTFSDDSWRSLSVIWDYLIVFGKTNVRLTGAGESGASFSSIVELLL